MSIKNKTCSVTTTSASLVNMSNIKALDMDSVITLNAFEKEEDEQRTVYKGQDHRGQVWTIKSGTVVHRGAKNRG